MKRYELPGRFGDFIIGLSLLFIGAGICVFGYQAVLFLRDGGSWTNINLSDMFDLLDVSQRTFLWGEFRGVTDVIWNCPVAVALILFGALLPFVYGAITDLWAHNKAQRAARRKAAAKKKALEKAD